MLVIQKSTMPSWVSWPEPIERACNRAGTRSNNSRLVRPDISFSDRLLIASITNLPRYRRPWGIISWIADYYRTSRTTIYTIGNSIRDRLLDDEHDEQKRIPLSQPLFETLREEAINLERTILSLAFPGGVSIRPMQQILLETLGTSRSVGFISQFLQRAGKKAGEVLNSLDYSGLEAIIGLRDETFFQGRPILLLVEPRTGMIVFGHVAEDRTAETWATALLLTEDQNLSFKGLIEDMAKAFPASLNLIESKTKSKKDNWHIQRDAGKARRSLERKFYQTLGKMEKIEKKCSKKWSDELFEQYYKLDLELSFLMDQHDNFEILITDLAEALEVVELKSGEIRTSSLAEWYLEETIQTMEKLTHEKIIKFVKTLRKAQPELLTNLVWLAPRLDAWREKAVSKWGTILAEQAEKLIARIWKLRQLIINGETKLKKYLQDAQETLSVLINDDDEVGMNLAEEFNEIFNSIPRTSSMIENINGLLKRFLKGRRNFRNHHTAQLYLNLFILWYNCHVFERGKRKGKSPFQWAKMNLSSDDWLTLLGFPKLA